MHLVRPKFWEKKSLIAIFLLPLSVVYIFLFYIKFFFSTRYKSSATTICIGNATIGGSGKTPTALAIYDFFNKHQKKTCIISRGYRGRLSGPVLVNPKIHSYIDVGDEALLMAQYAPIIIAKNKIEATKFAEKMNFEIIIFDDGLQNPSIDYNCKILILDNNMGNNFPLPAGPLRELPYLLTSRVDFILTSQKKYLKYYGRKISDIQIVPRRKIPTGNLVLFAGIANPKKFFDFVREYNPSILQTISFPDHHAYNEKDIEKLINLSNTLNATLVTTEKDIVKFSNTIQKKMTSVAISYKIKDIEDILGPYL